MKTLTIDGNDYIINDDVADLVIMISKERDSLLNGGVANENWLREQIESCLHQIDVGDYHPSAKITATANKIISIINR